MREEKMKLTLTKSLPSFRPLMAPASLDRTPGQQMGPVVTLGFSSIILGSDHS